MGHFYACLLVLGRFASVGGHIVMYESGFVTNFLHFATKSWTLIGSCVLISSIVIIKAELEVVPVQKI